MLLLTVFSSQPAHLSPGLPLFATSFWTLRYTVALAVWNHLLDYLNKGCRDRVGACNQQTQHVGLVSGHVLPLLLPVVAPPKVCDL